MTRTVVAAVGPVLAVLLLTGCGDDGGSAPADQPTTSTSSEDGGVGGY